MGMNGWKSVTLVDCDRKLGCVWESEGKKIGNDA